MLGPDRGEGAAAIPTPLQTTITATVAKKHILIVLPWLKHTNPMTAFSVMNLVDKRRTSVLLNFGDAFVAHTRNKCADVLLSSDLEYMLTIDDDMIVPFGHAKWFNAHTGFNLPDRFAGLNALDRLLSHGKSLVGALYFGRHRFGAPMYSEGANIPTEGEFARKAPHDMIKPTRWVGTGCMLIHRSVFEDIERKYPRLARGGNGEGGQWFTSSEHSAMDCIDRTRKMLSDGEMTGEKALKALTMLEAGAKDARRNSGLGMGEDVQLCTRAAESGHQPYVDMGLLCGHLGHACYGPANTAPKPKRG